jgi:hypothetical protein
MSVNMLKMGNMLVLLASCLVMISVCGTLSAAASAASDSQYSDLPPPPAKPEKFTSKQQLKEYLVKLHEYYAIIGRPRFGRSYLLPESRSLPVSSSAEVGDLDTAVPTNLVAEVIDQNGDGLTTKEELSNFLKIFNKYKH